MLKLELNPELMKLEIKTSKARAFPAVTLIVSTRVRVAHRTMVATSYMKGPSVVSLRVLPVLQH